MTFDEWWANVGRDMTILAVTSPKGAARFAWEISREQALEEAAKACELEAIGFLSPEYAIPQPSGSTVERFACSECARAIRTLSKLGEKS